jgi:MFS family permease
VRALIGSSTAAVLCIGMTNVGEVILAREVLDIGGSGLAVLMTAGGIGTVAGSLAARFKGAWEWRRAYQVGLGCMAFDLLACAALPSFYLLVPVFIIGGFGNGFALVHDRLLLSHATPDGMHGRLFALQKACTSGAFAISFLSAGAMIAFGGVQIAFLVAGIGLLAVIVAVSPRLRASWPAPAEPAPSPA